jgi:hypothetical protein
MGGVNGGAEGVGKSRELRGADPFLRPCLLTVSGPMPRYAQVSQLLLPDPSDVS